MELKQWIQNNNLDVKFIDSFTLKCDEKLFRIVFPNNEDILFDDNFSLVLDDSDKNFDCDFYLFEFGNKWFYIDKIQWKKPKLKLFKYVGKSIKNSLSNALPFAHLGLRGKYEILNGSGDYEKYCKKCNFINGYGLGICEKNTLAGVVAFQQACEKNKIKGCIGMTIDCKFDDETDSCECKVFVVDKIGWKHILKLSALINIHENKYITEQQLLDNSSGLIFIFGNRAPLNERRIEVFNIAFYEVYYQFDSVVWESDRIDMIHLANMKDYIELYRNKLKPILLNDSYYIDEEDFEVKKILNKIGNRRFQNDSKNQYYQSLEDIIAYLDPLFKNKSLLEDLFISSLLNTKTLLDNCEFKLELNKQFFIPKFSTAHLSSEYPKDNNALFFYLINKGMKAKGIENNIKYLQRLDEELEVIMKGGFVEYFLILWDVIRWCEEEKDILTGIGRGSAAGSLIAFLLNITRIDPLPYDLLFSRFLNAGRIGKSLPDIDTDFEGERREEVKQYLEQMYGKNFVCSIGSFNALKLKSGLKDLGRISGIEFNYVNVITSSLNPKEGRDAEIEELFILALDMEKKGKPGVKDFIKKFPRIANNLYLLLDQPKSPKVHPCATIILPNANDGEDIFDKIPLRKDGEVLISMWEGEYLEALGYLKEDILGIAQLDKFGMILKLIKKHTGNKIDIYNLPVDDIKVIDFFQKGLTGDVFQFGSIGLTKFCKEVKPYNIEELINMVALYRPGPIGSGAHTKYIKVKEGKEQPDYDFNLKEVTESTFGLYIFQEQVMKACGILGGFNGIEVDDIRKGMGKKLIKVLEPYKKRFVDNAVKLGCEQIEAEKIWDKLELFSGYGFNKSHAACYAMMGYISQWLKVYYPLEFWTSAFQFCKNDKEGQITERRFLSEIKKTTNLKIVPPDINNSTLNFEADPKRFKIYWSLSRVKFLGEVGLDVLLLEREQNGKFFSIEEFTKRLPKAFINKRIVICLILSGAFDDMYNIMNPLDRKIILDKFYAVSGNAQDEKIIDYSLINKEWYWVMKQMEFSGLGDINYRKLAEENGFGNLVNNYIDSYELQRESNVKQKVTMGGILKKVTTRSSQKGPWGVLDLDSNNEQIQVYCWNAEWTSLKEEILKSVEKPFIFTGVVQFNAYSQTNIIHLQNNSVTKFL
jgi:DNA polymerase-3 subunit alpha